MDTGYVTLRITKAIKKKGQMARGETYFRPLNINKVQLCYIANDLSIFKYELRDYRLKSLFTNVHVQK